MQRVLGCRPDVKGCSRTDAGVHARRFALSFCDTGKVPAEKMVQAFNAHLPPDIRALEIWPVTENFHARYAAHAKTYRYRIFNARVDDPFTFDTCCRIGPELDVAAMQAAAEQFVGTHDFLPCARQAPARPPTGTPCGPLPAALWSGQGRQGDITVTADGYLYNMVRILAGTLCEAGAGRIAPDAIPGILGGPRTTPGRRWRQGAFPQERGLRLHNTTGAPAKGLFLKKVDYDL